MALLSLSIIFLRAPYGAPYFERLSYHCYGHYIEYNNINTCVIYLLIICAQVTLQKTYINIVNTLCNNVNSDLTLQIFKDGDANK